jgi:hypothetical protein
MRMETKWRDRRSWSHDFGGYGEEFADPFVAAKSRFFTFSWSTTKR